MSAVAMLKALVFGDSQVAKVAAAQRRASANAAEAVTIDYAYVSASGPVARCLAVKESKLFLSPPPEAWEHAYLSDAQILDRYEMTAGQLRKLSPNGAVDLRDYDVVVITGGHLYSRWHLTHPAITAAHFSADCATRVCEDVVRFSHHYRHWLSHMPAAVDGGPKVVSMPEPLLNEASPRIAAGEFNDRKFPVVENHFRKVLASFGSSLVDTDPEILSDDANATSARFRNANLDDFAHLNDIGADIHFRTLKTHLVSLATESSV